MKRIFLASISALLFMAFETGCQKTDNGAANALPDVSNFSISGVSSVIPGAAGKVSITAPSLGAGTYTLLYNMTGANPATGLTATLNMAGATGSFQTPPLSGVGSSTLTITSVTNSAGKTAALSGNNTINIVVQDSTGLMNATVSTATNFSATDVTSSLAGNLLSVNGTMWSPDLRTIVLYNNHYTHSTGTIHFNASDTTAGNGSAHYGAPGIAQVASYGTITITATSPLLTGSFSFTNPDSSKITGTFSAPAQ